MSLLMNTGRAVYLAKEGCVGATMELVRLGLWVVCLPWVAAMYLLTWVACILGIMLSGYGYAKVLLFTPRVQREAESFPHTEPLLLSVIIAAYNEEGSIGEVLRMLDEHATERDAVEVIVVDGNSTDGTVDAITSTPVRLHTRVLTGVTGRGTTQNAGAAAARGEVLLFLHADTVLPLGYDKLIRDAVVQPGVVSGAFSFGVNPTTFGPQGAPTGLSTMAAFAQWRSVNFMLPYGDQALFMTRSRWAALGPFPDSIMMEDFHLVAALRTAAVAEGGRVLTLPTTALCSGRRWAVNGVPWNTFLNQWFVFAYTVLGWPSSRIYEGYYSTSLPPATHARDAAARVARERLALLAATAVTSEQVQELSALRARLAATDGAVHAQLVWEHFPSPPTPAAVLPGRGAASALRRRLASAAARLGSDGDPADVSTPGGLGDDASVTGLSVASDGSTPLSVGAGPKMGSRYRHMLQRLTALTTQLEAANTPEGLLGKESGRSTPPAEHVQ